MARKNEEVFPILFDALTDFRKANGRTPTLRELGDVTGIPYASVRRYLEKMADEGLLQKNGYRDWATKDDVMRSDLMRVPLFGSVPCGTPEEVEASAQDFVLLPRSLYGRSISYVLTAAGDSMEDLGISSGDLIYISMRDIANIRTGDVVVALDENGCNTLKVFEGFDAVRGAAVLGYRNERVYPDRKIYVSSLTVQGKAVCWTHFA